MQVLANCWQAPTGYPLIAWFGGDLPRQARYSPPVLVDELLEHAPPDQRAELSHIADLEEQLRTGYATASQRWPELAAGTNAAAFTRYLGARLPGEVTSAFAHVHFADLLLASQCAAGLPKAIAAFESLFTQDIARAIKRFAGQRLGADDLRQSLYEKLFVGSIEKPPRIAAYNGQGHLQNWLRVTSVRLFVDLLRKSQQSKSELGLREDAFDDLHQGIDEHDDAGVQLIKEHHRHAFKAAFEHAVQALLPSDRNMLRWRHVHGVSVNEIATLMRIHRVTATQKLKRIRETLHNETLRYLQQELKLGDESLQGFVRAIRSNMNASVSRILGSMESEPADDGAGP